MPSDDFSGLSRRRFLQTAAATGLCSRTAAAGTRDFPADFLWGASTSALQIEGAVGEDGRGPSIWETFAARPGAIRDGSTPSVTCDHYHRWPEDILLMRQAGFSAYRFSIAWPRLFPEGQGRFNQAGLDFYRRLIEGLRDAGIRPLACLYHWDLPQPLEDAGGWRNRDCAARFADYAGETARRLGDLVEDWFALNEPAVQAIFGYGKGEHAPGVKGGRAGAVAALYHQILGQGMALARMRNELPAARLGTVLNLQPIRPCRENDADRGAAARWDALWNRLVLDPLLLGRLPELLAADLAPLVRPDDAAVMRFPIDRLGVNYYSPMYIEYQPGNLVDAGFGPAPAGPRTAVDWPVDANGLTEVLGELRTRYGNPPLMISENGAAYEDHPAADGTVADDDRIAYLHDHLAVVRQAMRDGSKIGGYLLWSLLDNWEWQMGFGPRFGIVRVDYQTQRRTPKKSYGWYRQVVASRLLG